MAGSRRGIDPPRGGSPPMGAPQSTNKNNPDPKPSLQIFGSLAYGNNNKLIGDVSRWATGYNRTIRSLGGYWMGNFQLEGTLQEINHIFSNWLGCHFVEKWGGMTTWEGFILEMDMEWLGATRRKTLELMRNSWKVTYEDEDGEIQTTSAATNTFSIARYGKYEELATLGKSTATAAEAKRDAQLIRYALPYTHGISMANKSSEFARIDITLAGYIFTANWQFESAGDGTADNVSDWISEIITTNCPLLSIGGIVENTLQVYKQNTQPRRAWDVLQELVELGDANGNPWRLYVGLNQKVYYSQISTTPRYFVYERGLTEGGINPWNMQPAVIRDTNWPSSDWSAEGWLESAQDFYASEISVSMDNGLSIRTELFDEGEILENQLEFLEQNIPEGD